MPKCLSPKIAIQNAPGSKVHFIHDIDYEYWSKIYGSDIDKRLFLIPCGKCPACVQNKALEWTARLMKEAEEWKYTYFITLTYDDDNLKDLNKRDIQLFLKRFRKASGFDCKYYITGEYGEISFRPHYHAIFFLNDKIEDLVFYANNLYTSRLFSNTWQKGQVLVSSDVNERSIKYTIGYTLKKIGESKISLMSKGLGLKYLDERKADIKFSNGFFLNDGLFVSPPHYFIRKIKESTNEEDIEWLKSYENQPQSSKKIDWTIKELIDSMLTQKTIMKGKGVF